MSEKPCPICFGKPGFAENKRLEEKIDKWKSLAGEMMKSLLKATDCTGTTHSNCHCRDLLAKAREAGL